jgi:CRISPR-associated protein Cas1
MLSEVLSGDTSNREAVAAKQYWPACFGKDFRRKQTTLETSALNYGYAVIRTCLARALVAAGLLPCLGLHHDSQLNPWNLADDLLEPFRPWVDAQVRQMTFTSEDNDTLAVADRQLLANLTNEKCLLNKEQVGILTACEEVVNSLVRASRDKEPKRLAMVEICC